METGINIRNESTLHRQIKDWYAQEGDELEVSVSGFIIDIRRDDLLIEVQTSSFGALKRKLDRLLPEYRMRIIYPVFLEKWLIRYDEAGQVVSRRKSPRSGSNLDIFPELVHIIPWLNHPHLSLEILQISGEEIRKEDGRGSWRRKGISIEDRQLLEVKQTITVHCKTELFNLIGHNFPESFSSSYLARSLSVPPRFARKILYTLSRLDLIQPAGKSGNAILYTSNMSIPESAYEKIIRRISPKPGIMGEKEFRHSVVLVPFVEADGEQHLLFEKRAATIRQGGEICFPGGEVDSRLDADIAATVLRETSEELGLPTRLIELGGKLPPLLNPAGNMIDAFVGRLHIRSLTDLTPDQREVEELFLVPVSFFLEHPPEVYHLRMEFQPFHADKKGKKIELFPARQLGIPRKYWTSWGGELRPVYVYRVNKEVIWGITGEIIRELISYLEE